MLLSLKLANALDCLLLSMFKNPYRLFLDPTEVSGLDYRRRQTNPEDKFKRGECEFFMGDKGRLYCADFDDMYYEFCLPTSVVAALQQFQSEGIVLPQSIKKYFRI